MLRVKYEGKKIDKQKMTYKSEKYIFNIVNKKR